MLVAIALGALALRLVYIAQIHQAPFFALLMGDSRSYDAWAQRLAAGDWIGTDVFYQAPLYPYFLGLIYAVAGRDLLVVRAVQACLGAASCALLAQTTWRLFSSRTTALVAGIALAVYAPAIFFDGLLQKTALDAFFTSLTLWLVSGLIVRGHRARTWFALGLSLAALSLTRENALLLAVMLGGWAVVDSTVHAEHGESGRYRLTRRVLPYVAGLAVLLVPVAVRNAYVGGGFYLTTSQFGPNLYLGNNPYTDGTAGSLISGRGSAEYERQDAIDLAERAVGRTLSPAEVSTYWTSQVVTYIRSQPVSWLRLMARKFALLWNDAEAFDTESQESYTEYSPLLAWLSMVTRFGVLMPLAAIGLLLAWRDRQRLRLVYLLIATYAASVVVFFIYARYRFPLVPMLLPFAALAVAEGRSAFRQISPGARLRLGALAVVVAAFVWWPLLDRRDMLAVTEHNLGTALQEEGRRDDAVRHYRKAIAIKPDYAPAHSNLGMALMAGGDAEGAFASYRRALEIDPTSADAHFNYGNALLARDNATAAIDQFRQALASTPNAPDVKTNLGIALLAEGRSDEALSELVAASTLAPRSSTVWRVLGEARAQLGMRSDALDALQRAVALAPDDAEAREALARVQMSAETTRVEAPRP